MFIFVKNFSPTQHMKIKLLFLILLITGTKISAQDDVDVPTKQLIGEDLFVQGSLGIGIDIVNNQAFGFDTFIMKENNLRMYFDDTSGSGSFPGNDWRFVFNDTGNGGANYFAVSDATANTTPFRVDAGAPNNSLRVDSAGDVGIGTDNPLVPMHVKDGNSPTLRIEQDGSNGFTPQTWDLAGNEVNFFIRDVTNGSKLPFKIQPNTPENTLTLRASGTVGIGTFGPNSNASLHMNSTAKGLLINRMTTAQRTTFTASLGTGENGMMVYDNEENKVYTWNGTAWVTDTDNQDLSLTTNTLSLTNDGTTVDLSGYLDNTDAQDLNLSSNTLSLTNDATTVDLSGYLDNTDAQDLNLSSNVLSLTNDATTVDLSVYLDNTDAQTLGFTGSTLNITGGNSVDLSTLQDGTGTDNQELSLAGSVLSISGGVNTVDLTGFVASDDQNLTAATLTGTDLTIEIENGSNVTVDLSAILNPLQTENAAQQAQINDLITRMEALESCACDTTGEINKGNSPILYQNIPNPFNGTSSIKYYLPDGINNASIIFSNSIGQLVSKVGINKSGEGELNLNSDGLASGTYIYTLYVGSRRIDSKKMVIE